MDQVLLLFGPVSAVHAEVHGRADSGLDDEAFVALTHAGGVRTHVSASWLQAASGPRFRATGTAATYVVDGVDGQEAALVAGRTPAGEGERWGVEPPERWGRLHHGGRGGWTRCRASAGGGTARTRAVRGEGPVPVDPRDAVAGLRVLEPARTSAEEGRVVEAR